VPELPLDAAQKPVRPNSRIFAHGRTVFALMLREMSTRYGRSPGGYIWAILEPLGVIVMLTLAFSLMLRSPPLGNSFILFYATGYLPFGMFASTSNAIMTSLSYSKGLLRYPAVSWIDAIAARAILSILTNALVSFVLILAIVYATDSQLSFNLGTILLSYCLAMLIALGVGCVNCAIVGFFPIWGTAWGIFTRPLFLASLAHVTAISRSGYFSFYSPQHVSVLYVVFFGLVLLPFGLLLLRRYYLDILSRI